MLGYFTTCTISNNMHKTQCIDQTKRENEHRTLCWFRLLLVPLLLHVDACVKIIVQFFYSSELYTANRVFAEFFVPLSFVVVGVVGVAAIGRCIAFSL